MSHDYISNSGAASGDAAVASSAMSAVFADVRQEVDQGAVAPLFGAAMANGAGAPATAPAFASSAQSVAFAVSEQAAEQSAVRALAGASPEPELSGNGFTYRHNWGARRGQWTLRLNWSAVNPRSRVMVSIAEGAAGGPDAGKFIGSARYTVHNVAPRAGGVDIWVNIEWSSDILLYVDYLVVNP
nr:hypothetical protein [uncultured Duganella sp.]